MDWKKDLCTHTACCWFASLIESPDFCVFCLFLSEGFPERKEWCHAKFKFHFLFGPVWASRLICIKLYEYVLENLGNIQHSHSDIVVKRMGCLDIYIHISHSDSRGLVEKRKVWLLHGPRGFTIRYEVNLFNLLRCVNHERICVKKVGVFLPPPPRFFSREFIY